MEKLLFTLLNKQLGAEKMIFIPNFLSQSKSINIPASPEPLIISRQEHEGYWKEIKQLETEELRIGISHKPWSLFDGKTASGFIHPFVSTTYSTGYGTVGHSDILGEAERRKIKRVYTFKQSRDIVKTTLLERKKCMSICIDELVYFQMEGDRNLYYWHVGSSTSIDKWMGHCKFIDSLGISIGKVESGTCYSEYYDICF